MLDARPSKLSETIKKSWTDASTLKVFTLCTHVRMALNCMKWPKWLHTQLDEPFLEKLGEPPSEKQTASVEGKDTIIRGLNGAGGGIHALTTASLENGVGAI